MKFDYAYLENKKSELSVFQIALIYRNIPLFRAEYEPYMVCPICKEAKLTYVKRSTCIFANCTETITC